MKIFVVNCNGTSEEGYKAELSYGVIYFQMKLWNMIQSPTNYKCNKQLCMKTIWICQINICRHVKTTFTMTKESIQHI